MGRASCSIPSWREALQSPLGTDPTRADSKKEDKKAVALLAQRTFTPAERKRLSDLVEVALGSTGPLAAPGVANDPALRRERLLALKLWYNEWATTARAVIRKRVYLIRMGLASRRRSKKAKPTPPASTP